MKTTTLTLAVAAFAGLSFSTVAHAADKITVSKAELQKMIDEGVQKALGKYKVPITAIKDGRGTFFVNREAFKDATSPAAAKALADSNYGKELDRPLTSQAAIYALGTGEQVPEMTSIRDYSSAVISGLNPRGKIQNGWAVAMNLGAAWDDLNNIDHSKEENKPSARYSFPDYMDRLFHRTTLSLATTKAESEAKPEIRLAIGLGTIFYRKADPTVKDSGDGDSLFKPESVLVAEDLFGTSNTKGITKDQITAAMQHRRVESGLAFGIAPLFLSTTGKMGDLDYDGYTAYLARTWMTQFSRFNRNLSREDKPLSLDSYSIGITALLRYNGEQGWVDEKAKTAGKQDELLAALRGSYGSAKFNGAVEAGYLATTDGPTGDENAWQISGNVTHRVYKDLYFTVNVGQKVGGDGEFYSIAGFQIGASEKTPGEK